MSLVKPIAMRVSDVVVATSLSRSRIYELISSREIPSIKVGGCRLVLRSDLEAYFERLKASAA